MHAPSPPPRAEQADASAVQIGVLVPLTRPGWVDAGRHLLAGLELAASDVNEAGGITGRPLELLIRDTAADPQRAVAATEELSGLGVAALAGEYHSVVARAAATRADALGLPFLCSSAVLDALTEQPTEWVARLAPAQSHGWPVYAEFLLRAGHRTIAVATQPSVYWECGVRILPALPARAPQPARGPGRDRPPRAARGSALVRRLRRLRHGRGPRRGAALSRHRTGACRRVLAQRCR